MITRRTTPRRRAVVLAALAALVLASAAAAAPDRVITFEDPPTPGAGKTITNQYSPYGLTFDQAKAFGDIELPYVLGVGSVAHSGTRVAAIRRIDSCGDFC